MTTGTPHTEALGVQDLTVLTNAGTRIVTEVNLSVRAGELLGLLGETGAGKTMTARAILGLQPRALHATGRVRFGGGEWLSLAQRGELARHRGRTAGLMLQNPMGAFDPIKRIGPQLIEAVVHNGIMTRERAITRARSLCHHLGLEETDSVFRLYPHQLSGGMSQRVALALTLMPAPKVLLVDEPTSALDANLRVEALNLVRSVAREDGTAIVLISHDLGLVSRFCDSIAVLYAGRLAEYGPTADILGAPAHPYTSTLISCSLGLDSPRRTALPTVGGEPPLPGQLPNGCCFHPRCPEVRERCALEQPEFIAGPERGVACHFATQEVH
ncbi:ABC transporter ATP-binding protein [Sciscionella sediminilitoris]|uniref:ABC transporter ATP-binding protein n=1 Tax=Sciscionella sediminilitoris TaxID=1445613 RepID=UPI0004DEFEA4|nr:ABC transporter ATP-binding protein [Sciscionella sp. SE31]